MVAHLQIGTSSTMSHRIGSWKCWFLRRRENRSSRGKTSGTKLNPAHMAALASAECSHQ